MSEFHFTRALTAVAVHFGKEMTNELMDSYLFALEDYDDADLVKCCKVLIKGKFFPRAHDFIELIDGPQLSIDDRANEAWSAICANAWGKVYFPADPTAAKALLGVCDMYMIRNADEKELKSYGFQFRANYRMAVERAEADHHRQIATSGNLEKITDGNVSKLISDLANVMTVDKEIT